MADDATRVSDELVENAAAGIKRVIADGMTTEMHDPTQLIAVDRYLRSKAAAAKGKTGLLFTPIKNPSAV